MMPERRPIAHILRNLDAGDRQTRKTASLGLKELNDDELNSLAGFVTQARHWDARVTCMELLARRAHGNTTAMNAVTACLGDRSYQVRRRTCIALARIGMPEALEPLTELLDHSDNRTRVIADLSIQHIEHPTIIADHIACECAYDLYGRRTLSFCPECGANVGMLKLPPGTNRPKDPRRQAAAYRRMHEQERRSWPFMAILGMVALTGAMTPFLFNFSTALRRVCWGVAIGCGVMVILHVLARRRYDRSATMYEAAAASEEGTLPAESSSE